MPLDVPAQFNIADYFVHQPAAAHPDRTAILGEPYPVSYGELARLVERVSAALADWGCARGDRILFALPDSVEFMAAFFGAARIGALAVPVNAFARAEDFDHCLTDAQPRLVVVHASVLPEFLPAAEKHRVPELIVVGDFAPSRHKNTIRWMDWLAGAGSPPPPARTAGTDPAFFLYTSGSGGAPKAAVHRHQDMLITFSRYAQQVLGLSSTDRTFSVSKLYFAYGLGNGMYFPLGAGAATILNPERTRPERIAEIVHRHRPTVFFAVPTVFALLLREAERGLRLDLSSARIAVSAGEALPAEIFLRFRKRFGVEILDGIGSTEMLHMFLSNRPGRAREGSCGVEVPDCRAKIVDDAGNPLPAGEIGNLWVSGASAFSEYWNNPELTSRTKQGDWVITGDKFFRDAGGYWHYCGRTDDMLKVSGMWVSPTEVENVLLGHPLVAEAAVAGRTDAQGLVRPVAFVVLKPGVEPTPSLSREILESAERRLVAYKCPKEILFREELPKTTTGKIQRFRLRGEGD